MNLQNNSEVEGKTSAGAALRVQRGSGRRRGTLGDAEHRAEAAGAPGLSGSGREPGTRRWRAVRAEASNGTRCLNTR